MLSYSHKSEGANSTKNNEIKKIMKIVPNETVYCGLGYFRGGFIFVLFAQKVNARN